jgi:DNA polymerase-4
MPADASILHVDLDAFFAAVEQRDDPSLRGKPVIVGGSARRGVVATASYEARAYGVRSAMPTARARRACPHAVFLAPRFGRYREKSDEVMSILRSVTPLVEQLGIDEAFVDVAGVRRRHGDGAAVARMLRDRFRCETGLAASIGAATTKFLAKCASDLAKPDGLLVVPPGTEADFLDPLPASRLWGVGAATLAKLDRMGVRTIGDVARLPVDVLVAALGASLGRHLHALARNDDPRIVQPRQEAKSIGAEETFAADLRTAVACDRELVRLVDRAARRLRRAGLTARTVTLKIRFADFDTRTRSRTLPEPTDATHVVLATARDLASSFAVSRGVRLLGVSLSNLDAAAPVQTALVLGAADAREQAARERLAAADRAADAVRERFGDAAVRRAVLLERKEHA